MTEITIISKIVSATPTAKKEKVKIAEDADLESLMYYVRLTLSAYTHACAKFEYKGSVYVVSNGR